MHGKSGKRNLQSTESRRSADRNPRRDFLGGPGTTLEQRVAGLEARVTELEGAFGLADLRPPNDSKKPGPGRRPRISDDDLFQHRNMLALELEQFWPALAPGLRTAKAPADVIAVFEPLWPPDPEGPQGRALLERRDIVISRSQRRLLENAKSVLAFVKSDRFRWKPTRATVLAALCPPDPYHQMTEADPMAARTDDRQNAEAVWRRAAARLPTRQIANALAGVPEIDWRTSLDRCSKVPYHVTVGTPTVEYYARMHRLQRFSINVTEEDRGGSCESTQVGPFYCRRLAEARAKALRNEGMAAKIVADPSGK